MSPPHCSTPAAAAEVVVECRIEELYPADYSVELNVLIALLKIARQAPRWGIKGLLLLFCCTASEEEEETEVEGSVGRREGKGREFCLESHDMKKRNKTSQREISLAVSSELRYRGREGGRGRFFRPLLVKVWGACRARITKFPIIYSPRKKWLLEEEEEEEEEHRNETGQQRIQQQQHLSLRGLATIFCFFFFFLWKAVGDEPMRYDVRADN